MRINTMILVTAITVLMFLTACPKMEEQLSIVNKSDIEDVFIAIKDNMQCIDSIPLLKEEGYVLEKGKIKTIYFIAPKQKCVLNAFLISMDTIHKYGWGKVYGGNKILKRYDLNKEDLDRINWTITYP